ncbi:MAG: DUF4854 domain-containing protein [Clostridia bacterium]|nr:DUF4854 domain-containing protein [Clostridia bacterium]
MKKRFQGIIIGIIIGIMISGVVTLAKTGTEAINAWFSDIKICINGEYITPTDANGNEVEPFTVNGTTYLPVRAVGNALDMDVDWDNDTKTVFLGEKTIEIPKNPNSNPEIDKYIEEMMNVGFDKVLKSYKEMGIDLVLYSEGNTLVYDCTVDVQLSDEEIEYVGANMEGSLSGFDKNAQGIFDEAPQVQSVKIAYYDSNRKLIYSNVYNR